MPAGDGWSVFCRGRVGAQVGSGPGGGSSSSLQVMLTHSCAQQNVPVMHDDGTLAWYVHCKRCVHAGMLDMTQHWRHVRYALLWNMYQVKQAA